MSKIGRRITWGKVHGGSQSFHVERARLQGLDPRSPRIEFRWPPPPPLQQLAVHECHSCNSSLPFGSAAQGTVAYPDTGFGLALRSVAGAMVRDIGTKVFYVTTGGFDTHSGQEVNPTTGGYYRLMATLDDGLLAFHDDLNNQGLLEDTLLLTFSEFGRRITENGSGGTDHGAATLMMAMGGRVNGGLYGTEALEPDPSNPALENNTLDVGYETDYRSVYAQVIDNWLGAESRAILGGDFRQGELGFI